MDQNSSMDHEPRRRISASDLADSSLIKILQPIIIAILVPLVAWGGNKVLDRMDKLEAAIYTNNNTTSGYEFRMKALEASLTKLEAEKAVTQEKFFQQAIKIELLEARRR